MSKRYKILVYDIDGTYICDVSDIASMSSFTTRINSGLGTLNLPFALPFGETHAALVLGNEFRVYELVGATETLIYSGFLYNICQEFLIGSSQTVAELVGYTGRFANTLLYHNGARIALTRDGTYSASTNSTDTKLSSDQIKYIIREYRYRNGDVSQSLTSGDTDRSFGGATWRGQQFTTGTDTEQNLIAGVQLYMKYNTDTTDVIRVNLKAVDGSGHPTGAALATGHVLNLTSTTYDWIDWCFYEPYQCSASTMYAFEVSSPSAGATNTYTWRDQEGSDDFSGGGRLFSNDSGASWTATSGEDMLLKIIYVDESKVRVNETISAIGDTIADTGDSKKHVYTNFKSLDALDYVQQYAPSNWNWYLDENNRISFQPSGFSSSEIVEDCDAVGSWADVTGTTSITTSTSIKVEGAASVQFTLDGTRTDHVIGNSDPSVDASSYTHCGCWVYVPKDTTLVDIRIRLSSGGAAPENYDEWTIPSSLITRGAWNWLTPSVAIGSPASATSGTGLDTSSLEIIYLVINTSTTGETTTWYMDDWKAGVLNTFNATYGKNIISMEVKSGIDALTNFYIVTDNAASALYRKYEDTDSQDSYGFYDNTRVDGRLSDETTMDEIGNSYIAMHSKSKSELKLKITPDASFTDLRPGNLLRVIGAPESLQLAQYYVIQSVGYNPESRYEVEVREWGAVPGDRVKTIEERLQLMESYNSTTGDTPTGQTIY